MVGYYCLVTFGDRRGRMVAGYITTCAINAYHHQSLEFESR
jgi:hypothetical protein